MGDFDDFKPGLGNTIIFLIFMIACLFQLIIMLNLLIAIISDIFDKVQENKTASDCKERCALMLEVEENFRTNLKDKSDVKYIHICRYQSIDDSEGND